MGFSRKIKTTWANTDTRLGHNGFFRGNIIHQIAINGLGGGGGLKDFLGYTEMVSSGAKTANIQELKDLAIRQPRDHKRGPIGDNFFTC